MLTSLPNAKAKKTAKRLMSIREAAGFQMARQKIAASQLALDYRHAVEAASINKACAKGTAEDAR